MTGAAARSAVRVTELLSLLAGSEHPLATMTIARRCAIPKSSAYRLLDLLADRGFVERAPSTGAWILGRRVRQLAADGPTIADGVAVLAAFHGSARSAQATDLARETRLTVARVERTLIALRDAGLVEEADGRYGLGVRLAILATGGALLDHVRIAVRPLLIGLRDQTGETANLLVQAGDSALYVDQVESEHSLRHAGSIGRLIPVADTAAGAALRGGPTGLPQVVSDAVQAGVTAIACAIDTTIGHQLAVSVTGPTARLNGALVPRVSAAVSATAVLAGERLRRDAPALSP